jgi:hypothetical protein
MRHAYEVTVGTTYHGIFSSLRAAERCIENAVESHIACSGSPRIGVWTFALADNEHGEPVGDNVATVIDMGPGDEL